jgi:diguanylate cyclase (GGDEF)-like protein/putative nucleotidyltransferase with HDIG domain
MGAVEISAVLNAIASGIIVVDMDDMVLLANERASRYLGRRFDDIRGRSFGDIISQSFVPRLRDPKPLQEWLEMTKALLDFSSPSSFTGNICEVVCRVDGDDLNLIIAGTPVLDAKETRIGSLYSLTDVTQLRRTEEVLAAVSNAAREINSDLQIAEMLPSLFQVVQDRVPLDGMAILSIKDNGRAVVLGSIPEPFMGGVGASGLVSVTGDSGEILVDIVSDLGKTIDSSRSLLPKTFLTELQRQGMSSMVALPLTLPGQITGIWVLASREPKSYSHADMAFLEPVSDHLAAAVKNATLLETTREMYSAAVRALAATVDIRDSYTMHHSEHVSVIAREIALEMGLDKEDVDVIELAGLVHDIGKVGIPDSVLQKPGPLEPAERSVMTNHSMLGATILERAGMLADLAPLVLHHHEWHNGSGYPDRLNGCEIPTGAAILAVADAFDTMISDRPYRPGMSIQEAREELKRCAGEQFRPDVVQALERAISKGGSWLPEITGDNVLESRKALKVLEPRTLVEQGDAMEKAITSKELEVLFRIAQEMKKLLDLREILKHIIHIVAEEMGYSDCIILIPDEEGENLVVSAGVGLSGGIMGTKVPRGQGISWWVMNNGIPQNVPDVDRDERYIGGASGIGSELYIPLEVRGRRLGVLVIQRAEKGGFTSSDMRMLMAVAGHIASALEVAQLHEQVKKAADCDALTGLYNRRVFLNTLDSSIRSASYPNSGGMVSVAIVDIDGLKEINDLHGHLAGDAVLARVGECLKRGFRSVDVVARFGGDEFVVLVPGMTQEQAAGRVKEVIQGWMKESVQDPAGESVPLPGASFGVATYPDDGDEARVVLAAADDRLRKAKTRKVSRRSQ